MAPKLNDLGYHKMQYVKAPYNFNAITGSYSIRPNWCLSVIRQIIFYLFVKLIKIKWALEGFCIRSQNFHKFVDLQLREGLEGNHKFFTLFPCWKVCLLHKFLSLNKWLLNQTHTLRNPCLKQDTMVFPLLMLTRYLLDTPTPFLLHSSLRFL